MIIRVRTQLGTWKIRDVNAEDTMGDLKARVESEHKTNLQGREFTSQPGGSIVIPTHLTVQQAGLSNGDQVYLLVDESQIGVHEDGKTGKVIKGGNIVAKDFSQYSEQHGFRPGKLPLKSMKMQWTLNEFMDLDAKFKFVLKEPEAAMCTKVSLDTASLNNFQQYMWSFNFQMMRIGFLYGHFNEDGSVKVEFIYEPPQSATESSFELLEEEGSEEEAARVEKLAELLGVQRVGWLVLHPPREQFFHLSGLEVLTAAELQLEAAQGVNDTSFVTVKVTLTPEDKVDVYACQVSKQCMEMVAEGALEISKHPGNCHINETFTAKVELRVTDEVSTNFFMANVPIAQHDSTEFVSFFPRPHRTGQAAAGPADLRAQLEKAGSQGWTLLDVLSDFHLLLFLGSSFLDMQQDMPKICQSLRDRTIPLDEGYPLLLRSIAGMD
mmetsp:Transcript_8447/g.14333  ORF Transcript_8447/g.14333 Transcript_8447/m.14333 type:complete len:438 (+) Transcript_8447:115-1428(+)